jgi:hypothetical protein
MKRDGFIVSFSLYQSLIHPKQIHIIIPDV